ncbi:MAG TPA: hypothetical protein VNW53_15365 [Phenylobacterium sp.]|jgi:hypothetical protein|uniref:hypothetical protein n=1 Tax=Phenylobacterium sp. TaxID=1871053 RepID=UPI002CC4D67B|nr:hypothetical protein [Phenylobacterium sp.]HXA40376.1 hypothetical protein [Phenylobacterium sp.]
MSFREKSAWITLVTVLLCFGAYFGAIVTGRVSGEGFPAMHLLLACVAVLVVLQIALNAIAAATTPRDGRAPADERETLIQYRARSLGFYVLMGFSLTLFLPVHFGHSAIQIANFALLGVVLTTLAVAGAEIVMFRRGV